MCKPSEDKTREMSRPPVSVSSNISIISDPSHLRYSLSSSGRNTGNMENLRVQTIIIYPRALLSAPSQWHHLQEHDGNRLRAFFFTNGVSSQQDSYYGPGRSIYLFICDLDVIRRILNLQEPFGQDQDYFLHNRQVRHPSWQFFRHKLFCLWSDCSKRR